MFAANIEDMERIFAHCPHEHLAFGTINWSDEHSDPFHPMAVVTCALCDLMFCSMPDYYYLASKD